MIESLDTPIICGYRWQDGWGEHKCLRIFHTDGSHRCECDATIFLVNTTYFVDHKFVPGEFNKHTCQVMLSRFQCPYPENVHKCEENL